MPNTPTLNAQHFPQDPTWQAHCRKMARFVDMRAAGLANRVTAALESVERHADREAA